METTAVIHHPAALKRFKTARSPWLLGPALDVLLIGGASLAMFAAAWLFVDKGVNTNQISWTAFYLAMAINNPHFMASYVLLYWDKRRELLTTPRFLWAAVIAPAAVVAYLAGCIAAGSAQGLGYAVNAMYFLVGWHYVKQIYGTIVVTSARRGYYFSRQESWALKLNLFPVWFMSYFNGNGAIREIMHYGIGYQTLAVPAWAATANYAALGLSLAALGWLLFQKWVREGKLPGASAVVSFAAIYVWYLPTLYHAHFWYMIPFFHSLQYMLFVLALKRNQYADPESSPGAADERALRLAFARRFFGFLATIVVLAALTFKLIPEWLDATVPYDESRFGPELFMFCFITFINIHHYFIDNVIWRRDNPALKKYLTA